MADCAIEQPSSFQGGDLHWKSPFIGHRDSRESPGDYSRASKILKRQDLIWTTMSGRGRKGEQVNSRFVSVQATGPEGIWTFRLLGGQLPGTVPNSKNPAYPLKQKSLQGLQPVQAFQSSPWIHQPFASQEGPSAKDYGLQPGGDPDRKLDLYSTTTSFSSTRIWTIFIGWWWWKT